MCSGSMRMGERLKKSWRRNTVVFVWVLLGFIVLAAKTSTSLTSVLDFIVKIEKKKLLDT